MDVKKVNIFSPAMKGLQGLNPNQQPVNAIKPVGKNPFEQHDSKSNYGVGLVNSDLSNMSYKLPNGKISNCNTLGIG